MECFSSGSHQTSQQVRATFFIFFSPSFRGPAAFPIPPVETETLGDWSTHEWQTKLNPRCKTNQLGWASVAEVVPPTACYSETASRNVRHKCSSLIKFSFWRRGFM
ncbi:hypothetical protein V8C40DRAFT_149674 [Trichoderma camerunense]